MSNLKQSDRNQQIDRMVFAAILSAIILMMTFVDPLGYIPIGAVRITLIHIPVIVGAIILGKKYGLLLGLVFGLGSLARSIMEYTLNAPFINPIVSVLPRMVFGYFVYDIYHFFNNKIKNQKISLFITAGTSSLFHSLLVLPILFVVWRYELYPYVDQFIFSGNLMGVNIFYFFYAVIISNSLLEIALAILVASPIVIALQTIDMNKYKHN